MFNKILKITWFVASLFVIVFWILYLFRDNLFYNYDYWFDYEYDNKCNVWVIKLYWDLLSYIPYSDIDEDWYNFYDEVSSEQIIEWIQFFADNDNYDMILLQVDSYGWSPYAAEQIMNKLKKTDKDTVALIRESWDSAAYWASLWADKIIAWELSEVWSIWVIMSFVNEEESNKMNWIKYEDLVTWKFKNAWSSDKALTQEERNLFMRDINIIFEKFMNDVSKQRNIDLEKVRELSDWSTMLWVQALKEWLIDEIWDLDTVKKEFKEKYWYEAVLCEY